MMEYSKWFSILLTVLFIEGWCVAQGCLEHERVALLHLKSSFDDPRDYLHDWEDVKGSNCCEWERVKCGISSKRVIQLSLNETRGQNGYLNASLFLPFTELNTLYLNGNGITGFVENEGFKTFSRLGNLETLDLSGNKLKNNCLLVVGGLLSLKALNLGNNQLEGSVNTKGLNRMSKLRNLDLSYNAIESFQDTLVMMNLEELDLSYNLLRNSSFAFISGLSNLKTLSVQLNNLQGSIDIKELNKLAKLKRLDMSDNQIESIRSFDSRTSCLLIVYSEKQLELMDLEQLDLGSNLLNNSILGVVSGLSNLKSLIIGLNKLKGPLNIKELGALHYLEELDFSNNEMHHFEAPKEDGSNLGPNFLENIGAPTSLKKLSLFNTSLTGPLPTKGWCDLRNLEELDLGYNALEGSIPLCFNNLTSLRFLDISNNHIEMSSSFKSFTNKSHLEFLFIDGNNLVREPTFQTQTKDPKFQLKLLSMSNCVTKGLLKQLPNFLRYQYELKYLDLSYNNFDGQYPSWLLENNTRLQQFLMVGNSLKGPLQLSKHANVEMFQFDVSRNKMEGQIPMNICSTYPNLKSLSLSLNTFEGNIPPCLGGLKSLYQLDLSYNNFSGGIILEELGKSSSLWILRLSNNNLSGKIPPTIFSSSTLEQLYLDDNNFDGEIPLLDASTPSFPILSDIDLSNNHLFGKLPTWIWNLSYLETLVLSNNHFDGDHIPLELCKLGGLRFLDLSQNNLFGSVPSCISSLTRLEHLYLSRNKLNGPLPRALYNSSSLATLDLSHNNFTGKISYWISTLSALRILILKANSFEGEIPSQICRLKSLSIIDLSQNKLFGHIPSCLSNLTLEPANDEYHQHGFYFYIKALEEVSLGVRSEQAYPNSYAKEKVLFTTKKSLYTYSGNILDYMSGIDLSCNRLIGQVPGEMGYLSELRSLNLSHNSLTGFIPSTFSKLRQVESLDLSHNKLSGVIPIQLMKLNSLAVFNVSYNNLSGSIPHEKAQFATFDESSYLGNPFLCGPPKNESCIGSGSTLTTSNASGTEEESGLLDEQVFFVTFVVSYTVVLMTIGVVLYINPYWRQAWLYFIQQCIDTCYYFIVDNVLGLFSFRRSS